MRSSTDGRLSNALGRGRQLAGYLVAAGGTALLTVVLVRLDTASSLSFEALTFLALVVGCALIGGRGPAVLGALESSLALNWYFTPPLHRLRIASAEDVVALVVFLAVAIAVSAVVDASARSARQARTARREADTLAKLNAAALVTDDVAQLLGVVARTFGFTGAALDPPDAPAQPGVRFTLSDGSALRVAGREPDSAERRVLDAFAGHLGLLRDRAELVRQADAARELEEGNRIRSALLAAISHDLRTPLAGAKVAVSALRAPGVLSDPADREELLATVETSIDRMSSIVTNLLDMTRLEARSVDAGSETVEVEDLISRAAGPEKIITLVPPDLPAVRVDPGLIERVLANLIENANQHGAGPVEVRAAADAGLVSIAVVDHGPGVPKEQRQRIFAPFQRLGTTGGGVGLGLAVARGLAETQGGRIEVATTPGGGLTMVLVVPAATEPS